MRRMVIGSNSKMYLTVGETRRWLADIRALVGRHAALERFFLTTAPALPLAQHILSGTGIGYGAQDMHWAERGAYTGEISVLALKELGCTHVLIGHAERRLLESETEGSIRAKVGTALAHGLTPVLGIGETEEISREHALVRVGAQLRSDLDLVQPDELRRVVLAYEPSWAIGREQPASPEHIHAMHQGIRALVRKLFGVVAENVPIVYGGSVSGDTAPDILGSRDVDGLFVGRQALSSATFEAIVRAVVAEMTRRDV